MIKLPLVLIIIVIHKNAVLNNDHLPFHNHNIGHSGNSNTSRNMNRSNNQYRTGSGSRNWKNFSGFNRRTIYNSNSTGGSGGSGSDHSTYYKC